MKMTKPRYVVRNTFSTLLSLWDVAYYQPDGSWGGSYATAKRFKTQADAEKAMRSIGKDDDYGIFACSVPRKIRGRG